MAALVSGRGMGGGLGSLSFPCHQGEPLEEQGGHQLPTLFAYYSASASASLSAAVATASVDRLRPRPMVLAIALRLSL